MRPLLALLITATIFSCERVSLCDPTSQQRTSTLSSSQSSGEVSTPNTASATLPDDLELYMKLIRSQLASGQYDTAISTIEALKSAIIDRRAGKSKDAAAMPLSSSLGVDSKIDDQTATSYIPSKTIVAILPIFDETGAKDANDDIAIARKSLADQFSSHGFTVIDEALISKTISDLKIDLTDGEQQRQATFYEIGKALGANLVVFELVTEKQSKESDTWFNLIGYAKVKMWLLDDDSQKAILSAKVFDGRDGGRDSRTHYGSYLATHAVRDATEHALKDFFKPYPVTSKHQGQ